MTPDALAALHARCFTIPRPWTAQEFSDLLARNNSVLATDPGGFALASNSGTEAELLTIAVDPDRRGAGLGRRLLVQVETLLIRRGCTLLLLDVAADNLAAARLYDRAGFEQVGLRKGYYRHPDGSRADARVLRKGLAPPPPSCRPSEFG